MDQNSSTGSGFAPGSQFVNYGNSNKSVNDAPSPIVPLRVPPSPPSDDSQDPSTSERKKFPFIVVIALVIVAVVAGCGYVAYARVFNTDKVLLESMKSFAELSRFSSVFSVDFAPDDEKIDDASLHIKTDNDWTSGSLRNQTDITFTAPPANASMEMKYVDEVIYVKISSLPAPIATNASAYVGKWFSISMKTIEKIAENYGAKDLTREKKDLVDVYTEFVDKGIFVDRKFIGIGQEGGKWVRKYSIKINEDALVKEAAANASKRLGDSLPRSINMEEVYRERLEGTTLNPMIVTVDLFRGTLRSVSLEMVYEGANVGLTTAGAGRAQVRFVYQDFPTDLTIEAPTDATSLDGYITSSIESAKARAKNAQITTHVLNARTAMEVYYSDSQGKNYRDGCTKSATIQTLFSDIRSAGSVPICRDTSDSYIIAAPLFGVSSEMVTSYFCVDSTGQGTTLSRVPTGLVCR